ncbi:RNA polymerase sigma-70 factor, ECF subfamily [Pedobacter sp. ok626]|uniref:RNA polymerase sigma factor n=1 Tax=Pedobacter sp. ok626 TaxID=1761882 RepID=UPI000886A40E|nr:RNA polymerase sigma-70 factor [Pedobacter sp. ok626]SDL66508.1 RNA polymerase sigma-70 factor, ECF subfamily [Pedobacter sp. ok626]
MPINANLTDKELIELISVGEESAFSILYRRHWTELFGTACRVLRSEDRAEDVLQEIFLALWTKRSEISITGSVLAYLHTSVRYKSMNLIERDIFERDYIQVLLSTIEQNGDCNAQQLLQLKELEQAIATVVEQMPDKMKVVYKLSRDKYLTHQEIADQLGISKETVKKHIQHALQLLKNAIGISVLLFLLK